MESLIYFVLVLGITIFIHEMGHFIFAKRAGVYVYEFALGMGPKIWSFKRKGDPTVYSLRLFPIGGFVNIAGEGHEGDKAVKKSQLLQSKTWWQRFKTIIAGVTFNFIFAFLLLFAISLIWGAPSVAPIIGQADKFVKTLPAYQAGLREGDTIIRVNDKKISSWDDFLVRLEGYRGDQIKIDFKNSKEQIKTINISPVKEDGREVYGIVQGYKYERGFFISLKFAALRFGSLVKTMWLTIGGLFSGAIGADKLAGPIGIYQIVDQSASYGMESLLYLVAFLSINVGFINLLPFPAFDGGRLVFLIIEKIQGKPVKQEVEQWIHAAGFFLIIALMIFVTWNDVIRLIGGK